MSSFLLLFLRVCLTFGSAVGFLDKTLDDVIHAICPFAVLSQPVLCRIA
ncbi:MAG: hypothetical protein ACREAS_10865 [Nitrososphaera sp.]